MGSMPEGEMVTEEMVTEEMVTAPEVPHIVVAQLLKIADAFFADERVRFPGIVEALEGVKNCPLEYHAALMGYWIASFNCAYDTHLRWVEEEDSFVIMFD